MSKFRKKPVVIEAIQWTGENPREMTVFANAGGCHFDGKKLTILTLEGDLRATIGDWIIKGIKGEFYPCKPDIFEATYEAVSE